MDEENLNYTDHYPQMEDEEWEQECKRHGVDVKRMKQMDKFFDDLLEKGEDEWD